MARRPGNRKFPYSIIVFAPPHLWLRPRRRNTAGWYCIRAILPYPFPLMKTLIPSLFCIIPLLLTGCGGDDEEVRVYQVSRPENAPGQTAQPESRPNVAPANRPDPENSSTQRPEPRRRVVVSGSQPDPENASTQAAQPQTPTSAPASSGPPAQASVNPSSGMTALPGMQESAARIETPEWTVPDDWEELTPTTIRKGNFRIAGPDRVAEITVTAFPGDVGGLEANLNRWRRQVGLPPAPMDTLREGLEEIEIDGSPAQFVELIASPGAQSNGIAGAIIPRGSHTWFVKMVGDTTLLREQEPNLMGFLQSIRF